MNWMILKVIVLLIIPTILGVILFYPKTTSLQIVKEGNNTFIDVPDFSELNEKSG